MILFNLAAEPWFFYTATAIFLLFANAILFLKFGINYLVTPPSIFANSFIFMVALWPVDVEVHGLSDGGFRVTILLSVAVQALTIIGYALIRHKKMAKYEYFKASLIEDPSILSNLTVLLIAGFAITLVVFAYYAATVGLALLGNIFAGGLGEEYFVRAREAAFKWLDPRWSNEAGTEFFYVLLTLRMWVLPILSIMCLFAITSRASKTIKVLAIGELVLISTILLSNFARAPLAAIFFRFGLLGGLLLRSGGRIAKKQIMIFFSLAVFFPVFITAIINSEGVLGSLARIAERLLRQPAYDVYAYYQFCTSTIGFQNGELLMRPIKQLLGLPYYYIENEIYLYLYDVVKIFSGHNNAAFVANAFCDFGNLGVAIFSFICAMTCMLLLEWFLRSPKTPFNLALFSCVGYQVWIFNFGSVTSVFIANGLLFTIFLKLIWDLHVGNHGRN
jgi:hypothetical protein